MGPIAQIAGCGLYHCCQNGRVRPVHLAVNVLAVEGLTLSIQHGRFRFSSSTLLAWIPFSSIANTS